MWPEKGEMESVGNAAFRVVFKAALSRVFELEETIAAMSRESSALRMENNDVLVGKAGRVALYIRAESPAPKTRKVK